MFASVGTISDFVLFAIQLRCLVALRLFKTLERIRLEVNKSLLRGSDVNAKSLISGKSLRILPVAALKNSQLRFNRGAEAPHQPRPKIHFLRPSYLFENFPYL